MKLHFHPGRTCPKRCRNDQLREPRPRVHAAGHGEPLRHTRFDTVASPVGYLVLSSESRTLADIQDLALFKVRPMFSDLPVFGSAAVRRQRAFSDVRLKMTTFNPSASLPTK